jgi:hypothetical protein
LNRVPSQNEYEFHDTFLGSEIQCPPEGKARVALRPNIHHSFAIQRSQAPNATNPLHPTQSTDSSSSYPGCAVTVSAGGGISRGSSRRAVLCRSRRRRRVEGRRGISDGYRGPSTSMAAISSARCDGLLRPPRRAPLPRLRFDGLPLPPAPPCGREERELRWRPRPLRLRGGHLLRPLRRAPLPRLQLRSPRCGKRRGATAYLRSSGSNFHHINRHLTPADSTASTAAYLRLRRPPPPLRRLPPPVPTAPSTSSCGYEAAYLRSFHRSTLTTSTGRERTENRASTEKISLQLQTWNNNQIQLTSALEQHQTYKIFS